MKLTDKSSISVIIGPMYSGKSSELLRRLNIYAEMGFNVLYINSTFDNRSSGDFSTHNPANGFHSNIHTMKTKDLYAVDYSNYDVLGIDEAQFMLGLKDFCLNMANKEGKIIIVAGLNGDFEQNMFGEIISLIPVCEDVKKFSAFCKLCMDNKKEISDAHFTKRISGGTEIIQVGAKDSYIPVCRSCYNKN